jgi:hypothetical protein
MEIIKRERLMRKNKKIDIGRLVPVCLRGTAGDKPALRRIRSLGGIIKLASSGRRVEEENKRG